MNSERFALDALKFHNQLRADHYADPLELDLDLAKSAQEWANTLITQQELSNSPLALRGKVGENITARTGPSKHELLGSEITQTWYNDVVNYDFTTHSGAAGNFTQLVWCASSRIGFGIAHHDGRSIIVAHYDPPGNVRGQFEDNVHLTSKQHAVPSGSYPEKPSGQPLTSRIVTESVAEPSGERYTIKKEITEYADEEGNITQRIKEVRLDNVYDVFSATDDSEEEQQPERSLHLITKNEKELKEYSKIIMKLHNSYRKLHGVPSLKPNKELNKMAQQWAEHLCRQTRLSNSANVYQGNRVGENIASRWSAGPCDFPARDVVQHWYEEHKKYNYAVEPKSVKGIGNFTQVVWRYSRELGIGRAVHVSASGATKIVIVCHYNPPGNVLTCFMPNVNRPILIDRN